MKAVETNFLKFLQGQHQFVIPIYQRTYSWSLKQCRQLWDGPPTSHRRRACFGFRRRFDLLAPSQYWVGPSRCGRLRRSLL